MPRSMHAHLTAELRAGLDLCPDQVAGGYMRYVEMLGRPRRVGALAHARRSKEHPSDRCFVGGGGAVRDRSATNKESGVGGRNQVLDHHICAVDERLRVEPASVIGPDPDGGVGSQFSADRFG